MNRLTLKDRLATFYMTILLRLKGRLLGSRFKIIKTQAHWLNLEIRDLDKRYFKKRLTGICTDNGYMRAASGSGTGKGQQLFFHTFMSLSCGNNLERIRSADFPPKLYHLLEGSSARAFPKRKLCRVQEVRAGESGDQYLLRTISEDGKENELLVPMPELDARIGSTPLEVGDYVEVTTHPGKPPKYIVLDTIGIDEAWPDIAKWLEDPQMAEDVRRFLSPPEPAQ